MDNDDDYRQMIERLNALTVQLEAENILRDLSTKILLEILSHIIEQTGGAKATSGHIQKQFHEILVKRIDSELSSLSDDNPGLASAIRARMKF